MSQLVAVAFESVQLLVKQIQTHVCSYRMFREAAHSDQKHQQYPQINQLYASELHDTYLSNSICNGFVIA